MLFLEPFSIHHPLPGVDYSQDVIVTCMGNVNQTILYFMLLMLIAYMLARKFKMDDYIEERLGQKPDLSMIFSGVMTIFIITMLFLAWVSGV